MEQNSANPGEDAHILPQQSNLFSFLQIQELKSNFGSCAIDQGSNKPLISNLFLDTNLKETKDFESQKKASFEFPSLTSKIKNFFQRRKKVKKKVLSKKAKKLYQFFTFEDEDLNTDPEMIQDVEERQDEEDRNLIFVDSENNSIPKNLDTFDLNKYFKFRLDNYFKSNSNLYVCKLENCGKSFDNPSALGGHVSKNHHGQSVAYKNRQISLKNRKIEKLRNQFYKSF